jgi:hypothetical protein
MRWAGSLAVACLVVSAALLSSCSSSPGDNGEVAKSPQGVLSDAVAAMNSATSFRFHGASSLVSGAETFDLTFSDTRSGGTIKEPGATLSVVIGGRAIYLRASLKSWETLLNSTSEAQRIANKWIKVSASNGSFSGLAELGSKAKFVQSLKFSSPHKKSGAQSVTFHGQNAVTLVDASGSELYVAATGLPYVLGLTEAPSTKAGAIVGEFSDFDAATPPPIPTGAVNLPT